MRVTRKVKSIFILMCSVLLCACACFALSVTSLFTTKAATQDMYCDGASIRIADDGENGIRFHVRVAGGETKSYPLDVTTLTTGTLVIPTDKLTGELTKDTAKAANVNTTGEWTEVSETVTESGVEKTYYYMESVVYVYNIPGYDDEKPSIEREFSFRGYYEKEGVTYYTDDTDSRSLSYVAFQESYAYTNKVPGAKYSVTTLREKGFLPERTFTDNFKNTDKYLYRVGNQNAVPVSALFDANVTTNLTNTKLDIASLVEVSSNDGVTMTYDVSKDIEFKGTGVVTLTEKYAQNESKLVLEVIDAENITSKTDATANDVVLLNDISGTFTVSNGHTFYGNGFKVTCSGDGSYRSAALSYGFVTIESGGILDNVQIICDVFPESYLFTSEMKAGSDGRYPYGYSAVVVSGNSTISNSYIYGARNNILVASGNVTIENTVTECGSLSNIQINNTDGTVTLKDVTTIQYQTTSKYDTSKNVLGFGVLVGNNEHTSYPEIKLEGEFTQYNWVTSEDETVSNTYANKAITQALKVTNYQHKDSAGNTTVNMGVVYLTTNTATITDNRSNKTTIPYVLSNISIATYTGQVYSVSGGTVPSEKKVDYVANANRDILPTIAFTDKNDAITLESGYDATKGANINKLSVDLDNISGGSYDFKFSTIKVQKYGKDLEFTVKDSSGNDVSKETAITLKQLYTGEYTLNVTDNLIYGVNGNVVDSKTLELPFTIKATKTSIDPPKFTNAGTATAIRLVSSKGGDWRPAYTVLTGVSVTYWSASESKVKTVDLSTLYSSGTISSNVWTYTCNDYTLTITGGAVHTDGSTITPVVANNTLYFASTNKAFGTGTTSRNIVLTYVFTDKNDSTTWNRTETVTYGDLSEYDYNSFINDGKLTEPSDSCLAEGTLITLADGTQKAVEDLVVGDMVMVFNHVTGKYEAAPLIFNTHENETEAKNCDVLYLEFADGKELRIIGAHGLFDMTLMQYVYIDYNNYQDFIGHEFYALNSGEMSGDKVKLSNAFIKNENVRVFCPVTYFHMNSFANGLLNTPNIPGGITGLVNYFDYDEDLKYNEESMQRDIDKYGLYTYDDFSAYISEEAFHSSPSVYLKVAVGKGMITFEEIIEVIEYLLAGSLIE